MQNNRWLFEATLDSGKDKQMHFWSDERMSEYVNDFKEEWLFTTIRAAIYMLRSGKYSRQKIAETLGLPERQMEDLENALILPPEEINPFKVLLETSE